MMIMRKVALLFGVTILIFVAAALFLQNDDQPKNAKPLRVGVLKHESSIPVYVAHELGYFKKRALTVELVELPPGDHMPALLAGRVDILSPTSFPTLFGVVLKHPNHLYAVLPGAEIAGGQVVYGIVVKKGSPLRSLSDLNGKVCMAINPFTKVNLQMIFSAANLPKNQWPEIRVATRETAIQAVADGIAAGAIMDQPALAVAISSGAFQLLEANPRAKYVGSPYWSGAGAVQQAVWSSRENEFRRYLEAMDEAIQFIRIDKVQSHRLLASRLGLSQDIAEQIGGYYFPFSNEKVDKAGIKQTIAALREAGLLAADMSLDGFFPPHVYGEQ